MAGIVGQGHGNLRKFIEFDENLRNWMEMLKQTFS